MTIPGASALLLALACGGGGEPPAPAPTAPQSQPTSVQVEQAPSPVPEPIGYAALAARYPQAADLPLPQAAAFEGALNLERAPCAPCWDEGRSVADCALRAPPGCENLDGLVARTLRLVRAGAGDSALRAVLTYSAPWYPAAPAGPGWPEVAPAVPVELWVDPSWGPWAEAAQRAVDLQAAAQADPDLVAPRYTVRVLPTWQLREREPTAEELARATAVLAADQLGQGLPFLVALAAHGTPEAAAAAVPALDGDAWQALRAQPALAARLEADAALGRQMGLTAAPAWRVAGYLLRGHQRLDSLVDRLQTESLDLLPTLPPALVAGGAATPPGAGPQ